MRPVDEWTAAERALVRQQARYGRVTIEEAESLVDAVFGVPAADRTAERVGWVKRERKAAGDAD